MSFFDSIPSSTALPARTIPAQVNFLTIYNPSLGATDETEGDQIVFWASRADLLAAQGRLGKGQKHEDEKHPETSGIRSRAEAGAEALNDGLEETDDDRSPESKKQHQHEEINYRLRQIGLARGMVEFVKNFSHDKAISSVETQKSRIILHELEQGWWILASIDLTRLPVATTGRLQSESSLSVPKGRGGSQSKEQLKSQSQKAEQVQQYEYSTREVASPQLLLSQLIRAHRVFSLHHAPSLWDLYHRLGNVRFVAHLHKFWERFLWDWDVLLHGSPAVEVYGTCTKLAGGGELGIGVGEEEWGSGEREVLEGFLHRTEGCVDLIVGRYGDAPMKRNGDTVSNQSSFERDGTENAAQGCWLGNGDDPGPADGVIFSGTGVLARRSLASVSQWMEAIFKHGEDAYGVGENPSARPRQKHKQQRPKTKRKSSDNGESPRKPRNENDEAASSDSDHGQDAPSRFQSPKNKAPDLRRQALENNFLPPAIPPPLVSSVERSLDDAIAKAGARASSKSPKNSPTQEKSQEEAMSGQKDAHKSEGGSSWFDADKMTKVFTLGYGTNWTLNPKGFSDQTSKANTKAKEDEEADLLLPEDAPSQPTAEAPAPAPTRPPFKRVPSRPAEERLQELDPNPEAFEEEQEAVSKGYLQHLEKSIGRFLIGLSGDLENAEFDDDENAEMDLPHSQNAQRIVLRTLNVEVNRSHGKGNGNGVSMRRSMSDRSFGSRASVKSEDDSPQPKTSAAASIDGPAQQSTTYYEKVRVAVYVHQPFIFVFLFSLHTPNLTMSSFYRGIHHQLGPLQGPLLKRTDPERVAERIKDVMFSGTNDSLKVGGFMSQLEKAALGAGNTIYDLIYDPAKLTVRTSIPNIPIPNPSSDQSPAKTTTVSGSWYTLGIPIGSMSSASSPSRSPTRQKGSTSKDQQARLRAEQWSRMDALNVHQQILSSYAATHSESCSNNHILSTSSAFAMAGNKSASSSLTATDAQHATRLGPAPPSALIKDAELERTVKTSRGWWVLWMRIPSTTSRPSSLSSASGGKGTHMPTVHHRTDKEAFLIRKSTDVLGTMKTSLKGGSGGGSSLTSGISAGRWLLREQPRDQSSSTTTSSSRYQHSDDDSRARQGGGALSSSVRGVGEGVGIDARKWIDGLLTLMQ